MRDDRWDFESVTPVEFGLQEDGSYPLGRASSLLSCLAIATFY